MSNTFFDSPSLLLTSESVTEGHPDKLCDQISDAVLDALLEGDPDARVACEVAVNTGIVFVFGEISTTGWVDIPDVVRQTVREVGYDDSEVGVRLAARAASSPRSRSRRGTSRGAWTPPSRRAERGSEEALRPESARADQGDDDRLRLRRDSRPQSRSRSGSRTGSRSG